jgi:hypothetical protein
VKDEVPGSGRAPGAVPVPPGPIGSIVVELEEEEEDVVVVEVLDVVVWVAS